MSRLTNYFGPHRLIPDSYRSGGYNPGVPYPYSALPIRDAEHIYDAEEIISGPPHGSIPFNPQGAIPLPTAASGDVTVLSITVPLGYDGVILGQYNDYVPSPQGAPNLFEQGGGDIEWRVSADGRWVKDCGRILVTLGKADSLSTIHGGILLRSRNVVKYVVYAPNGSGVLTPGVGNIACGLHGYFWPRK